MLKNLPLTSAFLILSSLTSDILSPKFFLYFCAGILPAWIEGVCVVPSSHPPKRRRLHRIAMKIRYLDMRSTDVLFQ